METFQPEVDSEPPAQTSCTDVNNEHMVDTKTMQNFDSSLDGTVVLNPSHCGDVAKMLKHMQERADMCDISLKICNLDQSIPAHRCILAANSPVFYEILQNMETTEITIPTDPNLENVSIEAFHSLLSFMYKGELQLNLLNVESILRLSSYLRIQEVALLCSKYMQDGIDITNWAYFQRLTSKYALGVETELKISDFISENLPFLVHSDGIVAITCDELLHILKKDNSRHETEIEYCKLEIILKWISFDFARNNFFSDFIDCVDVDLVKAADIDKLTNNYSSVIASLPQAPWLAFQQNVNDHIVIKGEDISGNDGKYVENADEFSQFQVKTYKEEQEKASAKQEKILAEDEQNELSNKNTSVINSVCDMENLAIGQTADKTNKVVEVPHTVHSKRNKKRKTKYPIKLNVLNKRAKKGSNIKVKHHTKPRKPRTKAVSPDKIEVDPEESCDVKSEPKPKSGACNQEYNSDSEYDISENWDEAAQMFDVDSGKLSDDVTTPSYPKITILGGNKLGGRMEQFFNTGDRDPTRIKRVRAKKATTEEEMYACEKCPRKFVTPSALRHHMKGHGATQPFLCEICGFSTIHFASMNVHKRQHNDQLRYHCSWPGCKYTAIRRSRLDDHLAAHNGIKNYVCSTCGKAFSGRKHLHRHEQIHKDVKLKCTECAYESPRRDKLRDHLKKHHPEIAMLQGIMTSEQMQSLCTVVKPRKSGVKRAKKSAGKGAADTREDFRHEEDQKAASALQCESILTGPHAAFNTALQSSYIHIPHLLAGTQNVPDDLLQYVQTIALVPQQQQQGASQTNTNTTFMQPAASSQQFVVPDTAVMATESATLTTGTAPSQTTQVPSNIETAQQWYYVQCSGP